MSVASGIATFSGVSSLLQGRFDSASDQKDRSRVGNQTSSNGVLRMDASFAQIVERIRSAPEMPSGKPFTGEQQNIVNGSGRYMRFVDAVQALRLNTAEAEKLSPARVDELRDAAREVFDFNGGIPRDQRPVELLGEQSAQEVERAASEKADRAAAEADARVADERATDETAADPASGTMPNGTQADPSPVGFEKAGTGTTTTDPFAGQGRTTGSETADPVIQPATPAPIATSPEPATPEAQPAPAKPERSESAPVA